MDTGKLFLPYSVRYFQELLLRKEHIAISLHKALLLYEIAVRPGAFYESNKATRRLAEKLFITSRTAANWISELVEKSLLKRVVRVNEYGSFHRLSFDDTITERYFDDLVETTNQELDRTLYVPMNCHLNLNKILVLNFVSEKPNSTLTSSVISAELGITERILKRCLYYLERKRLIVRLYTRSKQGTIRRRILVRIH